MLNASCCNFEIIHLTFNEKRFPFVILAFIYVFSLHPNFFLDQSCKFTDVKVITNDTEMKWKGYMESEGS